MKYEVTRIIAQEYQQRRSINAQKTQDNIDRVYQEHPRLKEIDQLLMQENATIVLQIMQDGAFRSNSTEKTRLLNERASYLSSNQIPPDFDMAQYTCPVCQDTGLIASNRNMRCQCFQQLMIPLLFDNSNFTNLSKYRFSEFKSACFSDVSDSEKYHSKESPRQNMDGIRKAAMKFIEHFGEEETKNMFFLGKPGTGKTFLSGCIANDLINRGYSALYLSSPELYEKITEYRVLSNAFSPDPERLERASEIYHSILQCDLFILDDLGTETIHANRQPELLNILNHRLNMNKKMIISTNLDTASLSSLYDERVLSRIFGNFSVLRFFGEDLRHTVRGKQ